MRARGRPAEVPRDAVEARGGGPRDAAHDVALPVGDREQHRGRLLALLGAHVVPRRVERVAAALSLVLFTRSPLLALRLVPFLQVIREGGSRRRVLGDVEALALLGL